MLLRTADRALARASDLAKGRDVRRRLAAMRGDLAVMQGASKRGDDPDLVSEDEQIERSRTRLKERRAAMKVQHGGTEET